MAPPLATPPTPAAEPSVIDQLIPPPWRTSHRLAATVVTAVIVLGVAALWWTGVLGPNVASVRGYGYGAVEHTVTGPDGSRGGTVEVQLGLFNRGQLPVRDLEISAPPFAGAVLEMPDGPVDIGPRHEEQVTFHLVIEDCSRFQAAPWPGLSYDATSGRVSHHGNTLRILGADRSDVTPTWPDAREPDVGSWWYEVAQPVCDPDALHAP